MGMPQVRRRMRNAPASSASPAVTVMMPIPDTAPRTNAFDIHPPTKELWVKKFWCQKADHGATIRTSPASMK